MASTLLAPEAAIKHGPEVWLHHKDTIKQLYLMEGLSRNALRQTMLERYQFEASGRQYKTRLRNWDFRRNLKQAEKDYMARMQAFRHSQGKETIFKLCGRPVQEREFMQGRDSKRLIDVIQDISTSTVPVGITFSTPPNSPVLLHKDSEPVLLPTTEIIPMLDLVQTQPSVRDDLRLQARLPFPFPGHSPAFLAANEHFAVDTFGETPAHDNDLVFNMDFEFEDAELADWIAFESDTDIIGTDTHSSQSDAL